MRDRLVDGYRGVAVLCVVAAHALTFRFNPPQLVARLAEPLAETGVQLFFVISGYIITTLLLKEEARGGISIPAFYVRRFFRILPPLFAYYAALLLLGLGEHVARSAAFTCNITDCSWFVAHTWSLAVEEQFYLGWPLLLVLIPRRAGFLAGVITLLLAAFLLLPFQWHSNWISFACIAAGALYATSEPVRRAIAARASYSAWFGAAALVGVVGLVGGKLGVLMPVLVPFVLFAARDLPLVRRAIEAGPLNAVGLCSYSLYLWQQAFLGAGFALPLQLLPLVVLASYLFIERPFARLGHFLSARLKSGGLRGVEA